MDAIVLIVLIGLCVAWLWSRGRKGLNMSVNVKQWVAIVIIFVVVLAILYGASHGASHPSH